MCDDGYEYVNSEAAKKEEFRVIFMDINFSSEDPSISPPWKFLAPEFLGSLMNLCAKEGPAFVTLNLLCYNSEARTKLIENLKKLKSDNLMITIQPIKGFANIIVTMSRYPRDEKDDGFNVDLKYPD